MQQATAQQQVVADATRQANGVLPTGICYPGYPMVGSSPLEFTRIPSAAPGPPAMASFSDQEEGFDCSPCFSNDNFRRIFRTLVLGQFLSLCLCGTGVASQLLSDRGVNTPTAQSFLNYFLLCAVYGTMLVFRSGEGALLPVLRSRGWKYLLLSFVDVEANCVVVYAYQFTNLTSIQLLDCSTIPIVLLLSWLFLSVRYLLSHIVGVCICLVGIAVLIWADVLEGKGLSGGTNRVLGDVLCLTGSLLYSVGNVGEEYLVKQNNRTEYLGMVGLFGSIISGIQLAVFEHRELSAVNWQNGFVIAYYLLFAFCMFLFYSTVSILMQKSSALMFNLSVLTADFYTLVFGKFLFHYEQHALYYLSFALVVAGSIIYSLRKTKRRDPDEPRKVCPCCFLCCCCSECCFEDDQTSNHGSVNVSPTGPTTVGSTITSSSPAPTTLHDWSSGVRYCAVHERSGSSLDCTHSSVAETRS